MRSLAGLRVRWRSLIHRRQIERDMEEELAFHLEMAAAQGVAQGLPGDEARRRAAIDFGGVARVAEEVREERGVAWAHDLARDLGLAARGLRRAPGFAAAVVLTLGLGLGAAAAVFAVVDRVLLAPLPFAEPDRLVVVWETDRASGTLREPASVPDWLDFRERSRRLEAIAAFRGLQVNLATAGGDPERLDAVAVSHDFTALTGVEPLLGRALLPEEDVAGGPLVALLGEELWRRRFAADPGVLGRRLLIDEEPHTVVGVLPAHADFGLRQVSGAADYGDSFADRRRDHVDLWLPLSADPELLPRHTHPIVLLGRLAPGAGVAEAGEEMTAIAADLEAAFPVNADRGVHVEPLEEVVLGPLRGPLGLLLAGVGLVLLVACVNVANLLLARGAARRRETAVRRALGAGNRHLVRQFLAESALLAALGSVLGIGFAALGLAAVRALAPGDLPRVHAAGVDLRMIGVAVAVAALVAGFFALLPALQARRRPLVAAQHGATAGAAGGRSRAGLVIVEVALAVALTLGAGVLLRSFWGLWSVDPGFSARGVLKAQLQLPPVRYPVDYSVWPDWPAHHRLRLALAERLAGLPGVEAVGMAGAHPLDRGSVNSFAVVGREAESDGWPEIATRMVDPGYFAALRLARRDGRLLAEGDLAGTPRVTVINESAARLYFAGRPPVGQAIRLWGQEWRVVGVVGDERIHGLAEPAPPAVYLSLAQAPSSNLVLLLRATGDPTELAGAVRAAVRAEDRGLALFGDEPLAETLAESLAEQRFLLTLLGVFAAVALALAGIGIHGLLAYRVAVRLPELGLRFALGASRSKVLGLVMREGAALTAAGLLLGLAAAVGAQRLLAGLVHGTATADPATWLAVGATVVAAALAATALPARRASRADPMRTLRAD